MKTPTRFYRCMAAKASEQRRAYCPGLGRSGGQTLTAVQADRLEAIVLRWMLDTLEDTDRLSDYAEQADRLLLAQSDGEPNAEEAAGRLERLESKKARYVDSYAEGLMSKSQLEDRVSVIKAEAAAIRNALDRIGDIDQQRLAISVIVDQLMSMRIEATGDRDPNADEDAPRGSRHWAHDLREAAERSLSKQPYDRALHLPDWVVEETQVLAEALGVIVWVVKTQTIQGGRRF